MGESGIRLGNTDAWECFQATMKAPEEEKAQIFEMVRRGDLDGFLQTQSGVRYIGDTNEKGHSLLMLATYHGHESLSRVLLSMGADPNFIDSSGNSILMGVSFKGHLSIIKLLYSYGAEVGYANPKGQTASDLAVMFGRTDVVAFFSQISHNKNSSKNRTTIWIKFIYSQLKSFLTQTS
jgi:ankyrin repeat protein